MIFTKHNRRSARSVLLTSSLFGLLYPAMFDSWNDPIAFLNGFLIGLIGGVFLLFFELYLFYLPKRPFPFIVTLLGKVGIYSSVFILLILSIFTLTRSLEKNMTYWEYVNSGLLMNYIVHEDFAFGLFYSLGVVSLIVITRQVSRKMGRGILFNFVTGKFHTPATEHRIFLYIDLIGSSKIAESLGSLSYHQYLKQYFFDLSACIAKHNGEVYRYVGDQVVINWELGNGLRKSNAVATFYCAKKYFSQKEKFYLEKFGCGVRFRGALDMGEVLVGEIGNEKSQIVYHGDVLIRNALIEKTCKEMGKELLISGYLAAPLKESKLFDLKECGTLVREGENEINLFTTQVNK